MNESALFNAAVRPGNLAVRGRSGAAVLPTQLCSPQYTALILIILTFMIGAFLRGPVPQPQSAEKAVPITAQPDSTPVGRLEYFDLFSADGLNSEKFDALALVLGSHDLNARIDVFSAPSDGESAVIEALERSALLSQKLLAAGIPNAALEIVGRVGEGPMQARIVFNVSR